MGNNIANRKEEKRWRKKSKTERHCEARTFCVYALFISMARCQNIDLIQCERTYLLLMYINIYWEKNEENCNDTTHK